MARGAAVSRVFDTAQRLAADHRLKVFRVRGVRRPCPRPGDSVIPEWGCGCASGAGACTSPGAHPVAYKWAASATTNPHTIQGWAEKHLQENVGIPAGLISRLLVIDVLDDAALHAAEARLGQLPESWISRTPQGIERRWLNAWAPATSAKPDALGAGLVVHGDGRWVHVPGSREPDGLHEWLVGPAQAPLAPLPAAWAWGLAEPDADAVGATVRRYR